MKTRKAISVKRKIYDLVKATATELEASTSSLVEVAILAELERRGVAIPEGVTAELRTTHPNTSKGYREHLRRQAQAEVDEIASQHFTF